MKIASISAVFAVLCLAAPAAAGAATVGIHDGTLTYAGEPGEANDLGIELVGTEYELYDNAAAPGPSVKDNDYTATYGPGCHRRNANNDFPIVCDAATVTAIQVTLATRRDQLRLIDDIPVPVTYGGGPGSDSIRYLQIDVPPQPVTITADGKADDGADGQDDVLADVELLNGAGLGDLLEAPAAGGVLTGNDGDDTLKGGAGNDKVKAAYIEDVGEDSGNFYARGTDTVSCGPGNDQVFADRVDSIADDCEVIGKPTASDPKHSYEYVGSSRSDTIEVDEFVQRAVVLAGRGHDHIGAGFAYELRGQRGNDTIDARGYLNLVYGGSGNDVINSREKPHFRYRDKIHCGSGNDRVVADRKDSVGRDCEHVSRR